MGAFPSKDFPAFAKGISDEIALAGDTQGSGYVYRDGERAEEISNVGEFRAKKKTLHHFDCMSIGIKK